MVSFGYYLHGESFYLISLSVHLCLNLKLIYSRQHMVGQCFFLIHTVFFIGDWNPFIVKIITDKAGLLLSCCCCKAFSLPHLLHYCGVFVVKHLNSFLIFFYIFPCIQSKAILFVVTIGVTYSILKL